MFDNFFFLLTWIKLFEKKKMLNLPTVKLSTGLAQICNKVLWSTNEKFMCEWWMRTLHFVVKEGHCANSHWHYWCRQPNKTFFTEDIGTSILYWYLDYKLNFCEDTELIPSFYPQFQVKDRNALNVLLIFSLFDFWRKLTLFLSSLRRFNLENFWIYNIYSNTYMLNIWCWTWIKGADFHQKTLWSIYCKM